MRPDRHPVGQESDDADGLADGADPLTTETTALALLSDILADMDVARMRYRVNRVACPGEAPGADWRGVEAIVALEDMRLPANMPALVNRPFDAGSGHLFADYFLACDAGCYDISVQPLTDQGADSADCQPAVQRGVEVVDGSTREVLLIHQCAGPDGGGLDAIVALNHPPTLIDFTYEPSKFAFECEFVEVCATAKDPDDDPLEFVWRQVDGPPLFQQPAVVGDQAAADGGRTQCVRLVPSTPGTYGLQVAVYDLAQDQGRLVRIEDVLAKFGGAGKYHDVLGVPLHVNWETELECFDRRGTLVRRPDVRVVNRHPQCDWVTPAEYFCDPSKARVAQTCPGGRFNPAAVYPPCDGVIPPPPPPPRCGECAGKVSSLTLRWHGAQRAEIEVRQGDGREIFDNDYVEPGDVVEVRGQMAEGSLGDMIWIEVDDRNMVDIRTDCSWDVRPGAIYGQFQVVAGRSTLGGAFCGDAPPPPPACFDCQGGITRMRLKWLGSQVATIRVVQGDRTDVFTAAVAPQQEFELQGSLGRGDELGRAIWVKVNGVNRHDLHTNCRRDLRPGTTFGEFAVVAESSLAGPLCPRQGAATRAPWASPQAR